MDAFDVLALKPAFDLDPSELEQRYRDLQKQLHPDKFVQASASEKRVSLSRAVDVNQAYRSLRDALKRGEILLTRLSGVQAGAETTDPGLLMEIMELREGLAEAKGERNAAAVSALKADVLTREDGALGSLKQAFQVLERGPDGAARAEAHRALSRLRYYRRFQEEVARFEEETAE
ncbi:MAG: Fe-S protein assembly co-chaperone HscB [Myxococcales bacterium]